MNQKGRVPNLATFAVGVGALISLFIANKAFALSYSPSAIYPDTPYTLSEYVSNNSGSYIQITKDCFFWKNGTYGGSWGHEVMSIPPGGTTATCSSSGDTAGSAMSFQMNIWRPDYSGSVSYGTTGFTVQSPPVTVSASLSPTGNIYPDTSITLSGSVSGSGYTSTNYWTLNGNPWFSPGSGTGSFSYTWDAGSAGGPYTFGLCANGGAGPCYTAGTITVVEPPKQFDYSISPPSYVPTLIQGNGATIYVNSSLISDPVQSVSLSLSNLQSGVSYSVVPSSQNPPGTYRIDFSASSGASVGTRTITITGSPLSKTTSFDLTVEAPTLTASLQTTDSTGYVINQAKLGEIVYVKIYASGTATGSTTYSNQNCGNDGTVIYTSGNAFQCTYSSVGPKTISATATRQGVSSSATASFSIDAPSNKLIIQSTLDGNNRNGLSAEFLSGSYEGTTVTTRAEKTSANAATAINSTVQVASSFSGGSFLGWSGCDSTASKQRCLVNANNGTTKTIIANYGTPEYRATYQPIKLSVSSFQVTGSGYRDKSGVYATKSEFSTEDNVYMTAVFKNIGQYEASGISYDFQQSINEGGSYTSADPKGEGGGTVDTLAVGAQTKVWRGIGLSPGSYLIRICATPLGALDKTCTAGYPVKVEIPPPPPVFPCSVHFTNINNDNVVLADDVSTHVEITATGCSPSRWVDLAVSGNAVTNQSAEKVLDYVLGGWRAPGVNESADGLQTTDEFFNDSFIARAHATNNSSNNAFPGPGIGFYPITWPGGNWSKSVDMVDNYGRNIIRFGSAEAKRGLYNYGISEKVEGRYKCYTTFHNRYDAEGNFIEDPDITNFYPPYTINGKDNPPLTAESTSNLCYSRDNATGDYYETSCGSYYPGAGNVLCPNGTVQGFTVTSSGSLPTNPIQKYHTLNVNSLFDNTTPFVGVFVPQVGNAVALDKNGSVISPEATVLSESGSDFSGVTNYTKTASRNFRVTLEAPAARSSPEGTFSGWNCAEGGGVVSSVAGENPGRRCTVSFRYIEPAGGGQTKNITAKYSGSLAAPSLSPSTLACDAVGGKANVSWGAISGATGYRLYRVSAASGGTANFTPDASNQIDADPSVAGTQSFNANQLSYSSSGLAPSGTYYYKLSAFNSSVSSPASSALSVVANAPCPDLVVKSISIKKTDGTTNASLPIIAGDQLRFSAVIENKNGSTATIFQNQFTLVNNSSLFSARDLNGLGAGSSATVTTPSTQIWTSTAGSHSLQVCADIPVKTNESSTDFGRVVEQAPNIDAEMNNCSTQTFTVLAPITAELQCKNAGGTWSGDYCVIDYGQTSSLKWTTSGGATGCEWVTPPSDTSGTASGNSLSLDNLLSKLNFKYQLKCSR